jgi:hypothetical protein
MTAGVIGALLVSLLLLVRQLAPALASVFSRGGGGARRSIVRRPAPRTVRRKAPSEPPEREVAAAAEQLAEIRLWRGYLKCQLYIEVEGAAGALVESRFFRLRNPMAPDDGARQVLTDLLGDLERAGWSVVESGPGWYRHRLERPRPS